MLKVLLVDDEPFILQGLTVLVDWQKEGFEIAGTAVNGEEALDFLIKNEVDLIIADIKMPVMTGLELLAKIRKENISEAYFAILSGYADFNYATATDEEIDEKQLSEMFNTNVIRNTTEYLWVEYVVEESESEIFDNDIELSGEYNTLTYAQDATHNGYHTNAKENTNISPSDKFEGQLYSQITKDENSYIGANSNNSSVNFIEFVFDVKKSDPTQKLPFNFIVNLIHN